MPLKTYDLIIIGGGAGAFAAAIKANELKAKTLIINGGLPLGGTCVNVGCVPSKTLIHAAEVVHHAKNHGIPGIELNVKGVEFSKVVEDEMKLVERLRQEKYERVLRFLKYVTFLEGWARFLNTTSIEVNGEQYASERFIIATGSTAIIPDLDGIRDVGYITHIEAMKLAKLPKELVVIGAGPVGLELAQMYARFGTKVTMLQRGPSLFSPGEPELTNRLAEILKEEGMTIRTNVQALKADNKGGRKVVTFQEKNKQEEVACDEILLATGKSPNTKELNLETLPVAIDQRGAVIVNEAFQTSQPHIYAVGDVARLPLRLETTAGHEGTLAAENALSDTKKKIDYSTVPYTIFTDPQLASVGWTEREQMKETGVCACRTISFQDVPRAIITRRTEGLLKMAIDPKTQVIKGIHILAPHAGELIAEAMVLIKNKNTIDDVIDSLPMFPTLSESFKLAALSFTKDVSKLSCCV